MKTGSRSCQLQNRNMFIASASGTCIISAILRFNPSRGMFRSNALDNAHSN